MNKQHLQPLGRERHQLQESNVPRAPAAVQKLTKCSGAAASMVGRCMSHSKWAVLIGTKDELGTLASKARPEHCYCVPQGNKWERVGGKDHPGLMGILNKQWPTEGKASIRKEVISPLKYLETTVRKHLTPVQKNEIKSVLCMYR